MIRHRPTEIREVVKLLEAEHDDVEALAQEILDLLTEIKWSRGSWIAIQRFRNGPNFQAWGPYPTRRQAELDVGRRIIAAEPGDAAYFARVIDKDTTEGPESALWEDAS